MPACGNDSRKKSNAWYVKTQHVCIYTASLLCERRWRGGIKKIHMMMGMYAHCAATKQQIMRSIITCITLAITIAHVCA
jgi:hypothetical protein